MVRGGAASAALDDAVARRDRAEVVARRLRRADVRGLREEAQQDGVQHAGDDGGDEEADVRSPTRSAPGPVNQVVLENRPPMSEAGTQAPKARRLYPAVNQ